MRADVGRLPRDRPGRKALCPRSARPALPGRPDTEPQARRATRPGAGVPNVGRRGEARGMLRDTRTGSGQVCHLQDLQAATWRDRSPALDPPRTGGSSCRERGGVRGRCAAGPTRFLKGAPPPGGSPSPSNHCPEGVTVTSHASPSFQQGDGLCASVSKVMKLDARSLFPTAARGWHRGPSPAQGPHVPPSPPAASPGYTSCLIRPFLPKPRPLWHACGNLPSPG